MTVLLVCLASWRLWRLAALDEIGEPVRGRLPESVAVWLGCPWCAGFWVAVAVTALADVTVGLEAPVLVALTAAAAVPLTERIYGGD